jgi:hypothetical protein
MKTSIANSKIFKTAALILGSFYTLGALVVFMYCLGIIQAQNPVAPENQILGLIISTILIASGFGIIFFALGQKSVAAKAGGVALLVFVLAFNWIAFGPGERNFKQKISTSFTKTAVSSISEREGRIIFGAVALLLDAMVIYGFISARKNKI